MSYGDKPPHPESTLTPPNYIQTLEYQYYLQHWNHYLIKRILNRRVFTTPSRHSEESKAASASKSLLQAVRSTAKKPASKSDAYRFVILTLQYPSSLTRTLRRTLLADRAIESARSNNLAHIQFGAEFIQDKEHCQLTSLGLHQEEEHCNSLLGYLAVSW